MKKTTGYKALRTTLYYIFYSMAYAPMCLVSFLVPLITTHSVLAMNLKKMAVLSLLPKTTHFPIKIVVIALVTLSTFRSTTELFDSLKKLRPSGKLIVGERLIILLLSALIAFLYYKK